MRNFRLFLIALCSISVSCSTQDSETGHSTHKHQSLEHTIVHRIPYQDIKITDDFWRPRIEVNRVSGIRHALAEAERSIQDFDIAAGKSNAEKQGRMASDSDVYKVLQGAAYALHHHPDEELEAMVDSVIDRIVAAQHPDGYLFSYWDKDDLSQRWTDLERKHELYCAGHMFEAAAAYYQATGKRKFLDAAMRFADHIDSIFGPGKREDVPGHQEIELALYKLYEVTGEKRYLDLAIFFIDERGNPERIADALIPPEYDPGAGTPGRWRHPSYRQDHLPVTEQFYAVGHAVRATYLYSSMVDISIENHEPKYIPALDSIWNDIVSKKLYVTGGIGTRQFHDEVFGTEFLLPNDQAYCETCSSIGLTFWNRRMNLLHADAKYADLVELTMFNSGISGVSLEGDRFFYTNPLESDGRHTRRPWFNPACCPSNMVRFLPEIGVTIYGKRSNEIFINQFIGSETNIELQATSVKLTQETDYPWDGVIRIHLDPEEPSEFKVYVRIPEWAQGIPVPGGLYSYQDDEKEGEDQLIVKVKGKKIRTLNMVNGYAVIDRKWKSGDLIEIDLPMSVRTVKGDPRIEDTQGKRVIMRGPMVYCIEEADNQKYFDETSTALIILDSLSSEYEENLLGGVVTISGKASLDSGEESFDFKAIPYYAWNNRGQNKMKVWLPVDTGN